MAKTRKKDLLCITAIAAVLFIAMYFFLGFYSVGISAPFSYGGGDDFLIYGEVKTVADNGWIWTNKYLGAPLGSSLLALPRNSFNSFEYLIERVISIFTKSPFTIVNIQFLLIFPMCAFTAFFVLRVLKIKRTFAAFGAILYALAPYIFARNVAHLPYTACYFVPLSILLCIWCYKDPTTQGFPFEGKKKNNLLVFACTLLISANGGGYYAFFTCLLISVVGLCSLIERRKLVAVKRSLISIALIVLFSAILYLPNVIYMHSHDLSSAVRRSISDSETYGLKIAQFFIPLNGHGLGFLNNIISKYKANMPLVNENAMAYLGVGGIVGFLISLYWMFVPQNLVKKSDSILPLLSKLILCAILYAMIGGFSSLVGQAGFLFVRCNNRISIYILFICIIFLCKNIQNLFLKLSASTVHKGVKFVSMGAIVVFAGVCILDVLPTYGARDQSMQNSLAKSNADRAFVNEISSVLGETDMVYQLPYHQYMEAGPAYRMPDYQLFAGYLYSDGLRWSYGGVRGDYADRWNQYVSSLPMEEQINTIVSTGFKGIYINTLAYTEREYAELRDSIETVLQVEPMVSENGELLFYNLYPYIESHPELLDLGPLEMEDIESFNVYGANILPTKGSVEQGQMSVILHPGAIQYGPYADFEPGTYQVTIYGEGLDYCDFNAVCEVGAKLLELNDVVQTDNMISYVIQLPTATTDVEFRLNNNSEQDAKMSCIVVEDITS